jgi:thioredoxin reductase (NADPH)
MDSGEMLEAVTVIIAVGERRRKLGVPGEEEFNARGVSYCAPCDAPLFRGETVAVMGGGVSAAQAALLLAEYASEIYLIHRRDRLRARPHYQKLLSKSGKIEILWNRVVVELRGDKMLREAVIKRVDSGELEKLPVDGIFIEIGAETPVDFFRRVGLELTEDGYVKVNEAMETNIPGIYAAGDCTTAMPRGFKQIQIAAAQGAVAAYSAYNYILRLRG